MNLEYIRDILEVVYYGITILGIPVGIGVFLWEKRKERQRHEVEIYLASYDRYMSYLQLTLDNPQLGCGEFRGDEAALKESGLTVQQITMYSILIMILEQTYFLYTKADFTRNNRYWSEVQLEYLCWWASRPDFQKAWKVIDPWVDTDLKKLVEAEIVKSQKSNVAEPCV